MKNKSVMGSRFEQVPRANIDRSTFDRSHARKTAIDGGFLYPILLDVAYPGDTFKLNLATVARLATPLLPFMDNLSLDYFFFAVPHRLLWENWQRFMGEQDNPTDSIDFTCPQVTIPSGGILEGTLGDHFELPVGEEDMSLPNAYHFRAYNRVFFDWFKDENLQTSPVLNVDDGPDTLSDYVLRRRCKRRDYFTSMLPWPQKGDEVDLPLGESAPVLGIGKKDQVFSDNGVNRYETGGSGSTLYSSSSEIADSNERIWNIQEDPDNAGFPGIYADLSSATAATINSLREAFQLQRMLERDARGGTRYVELIKSHFNVTSPDFRLQRSEYLGGGTTPINVTPVANTSDTASSKQGSLTAFATAQQSHIGFTKSFVEHSVILGLVCLKADLTYQMGIDRMWTTQTKYDYYWPALQGLGEQEVLNQELFVDGTADDLAVLGYQERWAHLRFKKSSITGVMRSSHSASLDAYHLAQDFGATRPLLNSDFIEENPPISRVVAVTSEPELIMDNYFRYICTRPMPTYSQPGMIDHF